mmetsp:Transcript_34430/g.80495  ORF Transcript_34430/g.80495 Transcript_34430/m.80495 type:complete len:202 (+) Transcript_34430:847-1452(+)
MFLQLGCVCRGDVLEGERGQAILRDREVHNPGRRHEAAVLQGAHHCFCQPFRDVGVGLEVLRGEHAVVRARDREEREAALRDCSVVVDSLDERDQIFHPRRQVLHPLAHFGKELLDVSRVAQRVVHGEVHLGLVAERIGLGHDARCRRVAHDSGLDLGFPGRDDPRIELHLGYEAECGFEDVEEAEAVAHVAHPVVPVRGD